MSVVREDFSTVLASRAGQSDHCQQHRSNGGRAELFPHFMALKLQVLDVSAYEAEPVD
jgi:hypothetical protein